MSGSPLPRAFFERPVLEVARDLLGCELEHTGAEGSARSSVRVRLTEVEAYAGPLDPGSHAYRGRTARTAVMFGPPGHLYVYFSYGMHWCVNLVCGPDGTASAVLLRAGEVVSGAQVAADRRAAARRSVGGSLVPHRDLARGPARLARAAGIAGELDGADFCADGAPVRLWAGTVPPAASSVRSGPRVGVSGVGGDGAAFPWRFWLDGDPTVSPYRPGQRRRHAAS